MKAEITRVMCRDTCVYDMPEWVTVRRIKTLRDYVAYCRIFLSVFGNTVQRKYVLLLNLLDISTTSYVWLYRGEYVGIYALKEEDEGYGSFDGPVLVLYNFALLESKRGQGFGKVLLASAVTEAAKTGNPVLFLSVDIENTRAVSLYRCFGFQFLEDVIQK